MYQLSKRKRVNISLPLARVYVSLTLFEGVNLIVHHLSSGEIRANFSQNEVDNMGLCIEWYDLALWYDGQTECPPPPGGQPPTVSPMPTAENKT